MAYKTLGGSHGRLMVLRILIMGCLTKMSFVRELLTFESSISDLRENVKKKSNFMMIFLVISAKKC